MLERRCGTHSYQDTDRLSAGPRLAMVDGCRAAVGRAAGRIPDFVLIYRFLVHGKPHHMHPRQKQKKDKNKKGKREELRKCWSYVREFFE